MATFADAWRDAGGATPGFDAARFAARVRAGGLTATPRCGEDCNGRLPSRCWWAAVGAAVRQARAARKGRGECEDQGALF